MPRSREQTRRQFLDVGAELLLEEGVTTAFDIKLANACKKLNVTTGAAYQIWRRQEDYQLDLMLHIVSNLDWTAEFVAGAVTDALTGLSNPAEIIKAAGQAYFDMLVSSPEFYLMLRLWSIREPQPELAAAMKDSYRNVQQGLNEIFEMSLVAFDHELKPGYTIDDMSVAATAISEGFALRHHFDPEQTRNGERYCEALLGLFVYYTQPTSAA